MKIFFNLLFIILCFYYLVLLLIVFPFIDIGMDIFWMNHYKLLIKVWKIIYHSFMPKRISSIWFHWWIPSFRCDKTLIHSGTTWKMIDVCSKQVEIKILYTSEYGYGNIMMSDTETDTVKLEKIKNQYYCFVKGIQCWDSWLYITFVIYNFIINLLFY